MVSSLSSLEKFWGKGILTDLAAVQLSSNRTFSTVELADSDKVAYGDPVTAWGFPISYLIGDDPTLTQGIISAPNRIYEDTDYVQTDADVNAGNSGGPLIDRYGRVLGVNTSGFEQLGDRIFSGINFAITSNEVRDRLSTYEAGGPSRATYRNLWHGYGYSMDIPKGWYLRGEGGEGLTRQYTAFSAYGGERIADILTLKLLRQYSDRTDALGTVAGAYWFVLLQASLRTGISLSRFPCLSLRSWEASLFFAWHTATRLMKRNVSSRKLL